MLWSWYKFLQWHINYSTTSSWASQRRTASWMTSLMHWTSIRLLFLSKVWAEPQSWTSCLPSVIFPLYASIRECRKKKGLDLLVNLCNDVGCVNFWFLVIGIFRVCLFHMLCCILFHLFKNKIWHVLESFVS